MKNNKITLFVMVIGLMVITPGCKDYFDETVNPNLVQQPSLNSLLATATHKFGLNAQRFASFNSYYAQYLASPSAGSATDTYQITDNSFQWNSAYYAMADLYDMIQIAQEQGATEHLGVAKLLMAYHLGLVTDTWGSAPYSEAFGAVAVLNPAYDSEESLYQTALDLISESITELEKTGAPIRLDAASDLIHEGDREAWLKTAYGIKARFLNKISKKPSYDPAAVLAAVENSYTPESDEAAMAVFTGINPWAQISRNNLGSLLGGWLSDNFINHLNGTKYGIVDPRIEKITEMTVNGDYVGTRNGQGNVGGANTVHDESYISANSPWTSPTSPIYILTYAELKFIEAEAAFRAGDISRAYDAYLEGIKAHMDELQVAPAERDAYINSPVVSVGEAGLTLDLIFKEKYIVTYLNPEAWNDLRRHDYQYAGFRLPEGAYLDDFIRRVAYPNDERTENGSNVPAELPLDTPLWWDQP